MANALAPQRIEIKPLDNQLNHHPQFLPQTSFQCLLVGSVGAGKTTLLVNLFLNEAAFKGRFNRVIWASPTSKLDSKVRKYLMSPRAKIIMPNKERMKLLAESHYNDIGTQKDSDSSIFNVFRSIGSKTNKKTNGKSENDIALKIALKTIEQSKPRPLNDSDFTDDNTFGFFKELCQQQSDDIVKYGKENADSVCVILDDAVSNKRAFDNPVVLNAVLASRHYKITTIISGQAYHQINKTIRMNCYVKILYDMPNVDELMSVYEQNTCGFTKKEFMDIFYKIHRKNHSWVTINLLNERGFKLIQKFDKFIQSIEDVE